MFIFYSVARNDIEKMEDLILVEHGDVGFAGRASANNK